MLKPFGMPRATYYRWKAKAGNREIELETLIEQLCRKYHYRFGHRKIRALLCRKHNKQVNRKTVQRIMQKKNLQCRTKPKRKTFINGESRIVVANEGILRLRNQMKSGLRILPIYLTVKACCTYRQLWTCITTKSSLTE
ncbi:transposase [Brevibacterium sp. JNUCC-42]|nr:transposase [Brevibacterium sp. JNUCC-42]